MTAKQITKKLTEAGINLNDLEISATSVEVNCTRKDGTFSSTKTQATANKVAKALGWNGWTKSNSSIFVEKTAVSMGDWGDKSSKWHY